MSSGDPHPLFVKINRLASQLHEDQSKEKFELCGSLAALLRSVSSEYEPTADQFFDANVQLFCKSLTDMMKSRLSGEFRAKALNLAAALFQCYGDCWIDGSAESQSLLTIITNIASIEIRVVLARKKSFQEIEDSAQNICVCLNILSGSIHRLTNDLEATEWQPNFILSLEKCFTDTIREICLFIDEVFDVQELETNRELRQFLSVALETVTFWCINDMESLENVVQPLLIKVSPLCAAMKWTQICLNIVARLDHEDASNSNLVTSIWDENKSFVHFTIQCLISQIPTMKLRRDPRLINVTHYLLNDSDSLPLECSKEYLQELSKVITSWMLQKGEFGHFEAVALLTLACLIIELCQGNIENTTSFKMSLACATQVLWSFCGFNKHNKENDFQMPELYKSKSDELPSLIDMWCDALEGLSQLVRKHEFIARFLVDHKWPHRAVVVPMVGNIGMPEDIEMSLEGFRMAITKACPEVEEELTKLSEDLLQTAIDQAPQ